jgi:hypothetical protein
MSLFSFLQGSAIGQCLRILSCFVDIHDARVSAIMMVSSWLQQEISELNFLCGMIRMSYFYMITGYI